MFNRNSPLKRKHNEFHDPDYPQQENQEEMDDGKPGCSAHFKNKRRKSIGETEAKKGTRNENYLHRVTQIIEREFQREIVIKQQQLEEIDGRLEKAKHLLDRLRYSIVLAYYKKQEIPLTTADAVTLRGPNYLFERENKGPQMPLHPSLKKLIGKRPKDIRDIIRNCPKRTAAQNAVHTIRVKSQVQKREERKLKKIIRHQGIVIDHSKQTPSDNDITTLLNAAKSSLNGTHDLTTSRVKEEKSINEPSNKPSGKSLNAARLNNKTKHLIVVGNTSKYIGNELEWDPKMHTKNLTFKWLVYVQSKDPKLPIERFIKKVRFHLHPSYRPNDVVDIVSPPFQISRRGWGEFPIRVQLFFHSELHQKPIQLVHNIILDQTLSGIQTLGAETLLEIWLRELKSTITLNTEVKDTKPDNENIEKLEIDMKPKTNITTRSEELVDDNLLDFLNKIEASPCSISADIEKIQPTVLVNETFGVDIKNHSPQKFKVLTEPQQNCPAKVKSLAETLNICETPIENTPNRTNISLPLSLTSVPVSSQLKTSLFSNGSLTAKPVTTFVRLPSSTTQVKLIQNSTTAATNTSQIPLVRPITIFPAHSTTPKQSLSLTKQTSNILNKEGEICISSGLVRTAVHRPILPIVSDMPTSTSITTSQTPQIPTTKKPNIFSVPKQTLQKKLVQLIDAAGKVKYIQMLVVASTASTIMQNSTTTSVAPKLIAVNPSLVKNNTVTHTTQITNTVTTPLVANGVHLMPAMTTKPNIFKIVPERMQTKPQILQCTMPAGVTPNTNNLTSVNAQHKLSHSMNTTAQTGQITAPPGPIAKPNNVILPVISKSQNSNCNYSMTAPKKLVFQKEGKLYVIDPEQMKYKQQQKKQVSLLKPQINLLKQQQQTLANPPANARSSICDANKPPTATQLLTNNIIPQYNFGLKQQRFHFINALQFIQMKRMVFEKQFLRQEFLSMRSAVEFLLRRLKLVDSKDSLVSAFPFVSHNLQEFESLTAFKQRAFEWLRAKNISRMLRNHKDLQRLNNTSKEIFWSTKEIATFARQYAYTPPIKSLPKPSDQQQAEGNIRKGFVDLVKSELKQEYNLQYDTLTDKYKICTWVEKVWHTLEDYEHHVDHHQIIDIESVQEEDSKNSRKIKAVTKNVSLHYSTKFLDTYLTTPLHLENQCQLVSDICKDLNITLADEEIDTKVHHPSTQTVLAQCLNLFIEKVIRQIVCLKQENSSTPTSAVESIHTLTSQDIVKVLTSNREFDFLTNNNFGSASLTDCLKSSIQPHKP